MTGFLRNSVIFWRRFQAIVVHQNHHHQQQQQQLNYVLNRVGQGPSRFYSGLPDGQKLRNTSKILSAEKKGAAPNKDKITLLEADGSMSVTSLEEAQKLAKRRSMRLVKETDFDGKSQRPVYKLVTVSKIKQSELEALNQTQATEKTKSVNAVPTKGEKMLSLNNKIADHDLQSRLKNIEKWLTKQHKIVVVISGSVSDVTLSEKIFKQMEEVANGKGKIVQKRVKGSDIRFQIVPTPNQSPPPSG